MHAYRWASILGTDNATPSSLRFAWVAAYTVSPFGSAERAWKPFNPILGETFELDIGNGVRYLAEQVGGWVGGWGYCCMRCVCEMEQMG